MPIYEFQCVCGHCEEHYFSTTRDVVLPNCQHGAALVPMARVPSRPSGYRLTGVDEKERRSAVICRHNVDYWNSKAGREQYLDDKSGRPDLTQLENTVPSRR